LDIYVSFGLLSPGKDHADQTLSATTGQPLGQIFQPPGAFKMGGLGVAYAFLSIGAFRFKANAEYAGSFQNGGGTLRYLEYQGTTTQFTEADGTLKAASVNLGATVVYVSTGAGEYGLTLERRSQALEFDMTQVLQSYAGVDTLLAGQRMKKTLTDPFLSAHGTFVQHYEAFSVFSRLAFGVNLKSSPAFSTYREQQFQALDPGLLAALRPRQEVKLSLGVRF
jgi:hypothetical protein